MPNARVKGVHLHYSVIRPEAGAIIEKGSGNGGSIGIHLDGFILPTVRLPSPTATRNGVLFRAPTRRLRPTIPQTLSIVSETGLQSHWADSAMSALRLRNPRPTPASDRTFRTA
jgi:hypothetical protein